MLLPLAGPSHLRRARRAVTLIAPTLGAPLPHPGRATPRAETCRPATPRKRYSTVPCRYATKNQGALPTHPLTGRPAAPPPGSLRSPVRRHQPGRLIQGGRPVDNPLMPPEGGRVDNALASRGQPRRAERGRRTLPSGCPQLANPLTTLINRLPTGRPSPLHPAAHPCGATATASWKEEVGGAGLAPRPQLSSIP